MKKGLIIGIAIALVVVIAGIVVVANCFAPDFNVNGTYKTEDGLTATVSGDKIVFADSDIELTIKEKGFSFNYLLAGKTIKIYSITNGSNDEEIVIHKENGAVLFGFEDNTYTLEK